MKCLQNNTSFWRTCAIAFILGAIIVPIVIGRLFPETVYSAGFGMSGWKQVKVGMAVSELKPLLGDPLLVFPMNKPQTEVFVYSQGRTAHSDFVRYEVVIRDGRVVGKDRFMWRD
jgi:hypothetical protein